MNIIDNIIIVNTFLMREYFFIPGSNTCPRAKDWARKTYSKLLQFIIIRGTFF
jgi:hypothetical protein